MTPAGIVAVVGVVLGALWVLPRADPAWTISLGLAATVFSGHWQLMGVPIALDRVLVAVGVGMLLLGVGPARGRPPLRLGVAHLLLAAVVAYAVCSALWVHGLDRDARFQILDGLGVVPFVLFAVAPVVFREDRHREVLLRVLVVLGLYLGLTTIFAAAKIDALVWPKYILDPDVGIHAGRARGPFLEAVGNGVALIMCGTAAAVALSRWRGPIARTAALAVLGLSFAGVTLTYTRSVWLGLVVALIAAVVAYPVLWRRVIPAMVAGAIAVIMAITLVPGFGDKLDERYHARGPVWVRQHTNAAALRMIDARPLLGFGWNRFTEEALPYYRDIPGTKLTGYNEPVHNVVLLRAVEIGLVGAALWLLAMLVAFVAPMFRRVDGSLRAWQRGYVVVLVAEMVAAAVTPLGIPFPLAVVAVWSGLLLAPDPEVAPVPAPAV